MKKHTEKQPIDDLFARKLGNMSLPPSSDGFERLQMRMGQNRPEARIVFWRNPVMQRSMAVAACLLLVCLFGWLYLSSDSKTTSEGQQVAIRQTSPLRPEKPAKEPVSPSDTKSLPDVVNPIVSNQQADSERLAIVENTPQNEKGNNQSTTRPIKAKTIVPQSEGLVRSEPVLAQMKPTESKANSDAVTPQDVTQMNQKTSEQVADNKETVKPTPTAERVLIVTIAEPESLVAARQAAKASVEEKPVVAVDDKIEKDTKAGGLWQQVKRIKQGELFAHGDNKSNDDRGLLSRAYDGLKHSLDKEKSVKQ